MPSISSCPECHRDLTLPDLADRSQTLRCPLCDAQFPAERAIADSVSFPPTAIVVSASAAAAPTVEHPVKSELWPTATSRDTAIGEDAERRSVDESDTAESEPDEADVGEADLDESDIETDDDDASPADSHIADSEESSEYASFGRQAAGMRTAPRTRRQASPLAVLGQLVGMVLGGLLGLALGYLVLLWLGGPQADFLHLRGKMPRWLLPSPRHNNAERTRPLTREESRLGQAGRSLADLLQDPPSNATNDGPAVDETTSGAAEPPAKDTTTPPDEPAAAGDSRPTAPSEVTPVGRLQPGQHAFPEGYLGPRAFKSRTVSELTAILEKADRALRCPHCQAPSAVKLAAFTAPATDSPSQAQDLLNPRSCEYCRGKPPTNLTAKAFDRLCDLGEIVTFVQFDQDDPHRDECRRAAEEIALAVGSQRGRTETAGRLAGRRLDESQRRSNGILLAGTVQRAEREGELFAIQVMLLGCGKPVTVISREPPDPPVERRNRVVVLGSIVDSPRDNLAGYAGNLPQVVWGGLPLKLGPVAR
ncbi:MAG TPA: hypothetical protein VG826_28100 [Pirellulales bacterium]|nr:hypothetical protein [Pirellulales bacterium]